jgi:hypothetical protein
MSMYRGVYFRYLANQRHEVPIGQYTHDTRI